MTFGETMKAPIIIIEDEADIAELVSYFLEKEGFEVFHFLNGEDFLEEISRLPIPELILLDLMLPGIDGLELFRYLQADDRWKHVPVIMVTAKDDLADVVLGLELGADDYVTKPFHPRELVARIKAVTRRNTIPKESSSDFLKVGPFTLFYRQLKVEVGGTMVELSWREFRIFEILLKNPGMIFSREKIIDLIWGNDSYPIDRIVDVYVANIRKKLGNFASHLQTIRGVGYKIEL